jgi:hypothetical protein
VIRRAKIIFQKTVPKKQDRIIGNRSIRNKNTQHQMPKSVFPASTSIYITYKAYKIFVRNFISDNWSQGGKILMTARGKSTLLWTDDTEAVACQAQCRHNSVGGCCAGLAFPNCRRTPVSQQQPASLPVGRLHNERPAPTQALCAQSCPKVSVVTKTERLLPNKK